MKMVYTKMGDSVKAISNKIAAAPKRIFISVLILLIVLNVIAWNQEWVLDNTYVGPFQDIQKTIQGFTKILSKGKMFSFTPFRVPLAVVTIIDLVLIFYRKKYILVKLVSFSPDLASATVSKKGRRIIHKSIDLCSAMNNGDISTAVDILDTEVEGINKKRRNSELGIYGIMHTPLLFRAGYLLGDQNNTDLYHKKRLNGSMFEEWGKESDRFRFEKREENEDVDSQELLVSVAISLPIKDAELADLQPDNKHILKFEAESCDFDVLKNYTDAENLRNSIMSNMRRVCKKYNIKRVHFAIAASSAFTIFLGMAYSRQHDPDCIVYHYEKGLYPWGLDIDAPPKSCFIRNETSRTIAT